MPFLREALARYPKNLALEDGEESWTYGDLDAEARRIARQLTSLGIGAGDRVALAGTLSRSTIASFHGVWLLGGSVAPLNPRWTPRETRRALEVLSPKVVLREGTVPEPRGAIPFQGDAVDGDPVASDPPASGAAAVQNHPRSVFESREAACLLTSGTSGEPRVVSITAGNLEASALGSRQRLGLSPSDRWLAALSLAHVGGLALLTRATFLGSAVTLRGQFQVGSLIASIRDGTVTHASLVPTMLFRLLEAWSDAPVPDTLRCILLGGAPAGRSLLEAASEIGFPLALTYGLTEATSQVATATPDLVREKPGTVGAPLPGVTVKVSRSGELLVAGPTVAPGQTDRNGWLHTGDLARQDPDGHLWILGRISDRVITGGVNVDPAEVEAVLEAHPGILDSAVLGIPDPEWGQRLVAGVVPTKEGTLTEGDVGKWVRGQLSGPKVPRDIKLLKEIPRNPNGKVDRGRLQVLFR